MPRASKNNISHFLIVGATHGHEVLGVRIIDELKKLTSGKNIEMVIGNPLAYERGVAFVESDLNRSFPGNPRGTYEQRRAYELMNAITAADFVVDIHSTRTTTSPDEAMCIVVRWDDEMRDLIRFLAPPKVLVMRHNASGALIAHAKTGIALEYGANESIYAYERALHNICALLARFGSLDNNPYSPPERIDATEVFEVYGVVPKPQGACVFDVSVRNFVEVKKGERIAVCGKDEILADETFIPILFGKNRYKDIFGFKARFLEAVAN